MKNNHHYIFIQVQSNFIWYGWNILLVKARFRKLQIYRIIPNLIAIWDSEHSNYAHAMCLSSVYPLCGNLTIHVRLLNAAKPWILYTILHIFSFQMSYQKPPLMSFIPDNCELIWGGRAHANQSLSFKVNVELIIESFLDAKHLYW